MKNNNSLIDNNYNNNNNYNPENDKDYIILAAKLDNLQAFIKEIKDLKEIISNKINSLQQQIINDLENLLNTNVKDIASYLNILIDNYRLHSIKIDQIWDDKLKSLKNWQD